MSAQLPCWMLSTNAQLECSALNLSAQHQFSITLYCFISLILGLCRAPSAPAYSTLLSRSGTPAVQRWHPVVQRWHLWTTGWHPWTAKCHPLTAECHLWTAGCHLWTTECHLWTTECCSCRLEQRGPDITPRTVGQNNSHPFPIWCSVNNIHQCVLGPKIKYWYNKKWLTIPLTMIGVNDCQDIVTGPWAHLPIRELDMLFFYPCYLTWSSG